MKGGVWACFGLLAGLVWFCPFTAYAEYKFFSVDTVGFEGVVVSRDVGALGFEGVVGGLVPLGRLLAAFGVEYGFDADSREVWALRGDYSLRVSIDDARVTVVDGAAYVGRDFAADVIRGMSGGVCDADFYLGSSERVAVSSVRGLGLRFRHYAARGYVTLARNGGGRNFAKIKDFGAAAIKDGAGYLSVELVADAPDIVTYEANGDVCLWYAPAFNRVGGWTCLSDGYIAHAGGGFEGFYGLNAPEIMRWYYKRGWRVFELDFNLTSDGRLAVLHDWEYYGGVMTADEWRQVRLGGAFTAMLAEDVFAFLAECPDAYIVADTKTFDNGGKDAKRVYRAMLKAAESVDAALMERVVPQMYNRGDYDVYKSVYPFKSLIFTLYATAETQAEIVDFCEAHDDVHAVAMPFERAEAGFVAELNGARKRVYTHTVNDPAHALELKRRGVWGFYSDYLPHEWRDDRYYMYERPGY